MADEESTDDAGAEPAVNGAAPTPAPDPVAAESEVPPEAAAPVEPAEPAEPAEPEPAEPAEPAPAPEPSAPASSGAEEPGDAVVEAVTAEDLPPEDGGAADEAPGTLVPDQAPDDAPVEAEADATAERLDALLIEVERVNVRLDELSRLGQRQMEHIDRLHAENQQLRAGELRQAVSPLLRALIRHHDNVAKLAETSEADSAEAKAMEMIRSGLLSVLNTAGVEAFEVAAQDKFDPARHQGVSRVETDDADLDGAVAQMRRCGFVGDDGRVIRPAEVDVYRLA